MPEIRAGIDELDRRIVALLAERMRYIEAAARVKETRGTVRDEWRKADVIEKAQATARSEKLDDGLVADLYELLVERSIAHEFVVFDALEKT
ncbi:Isochorismate pyruvate-lyase [Pacificimonas flava]|uniref:chorismate mutase n=2 Tax=Pacificimonas flava TaxID=1234595 RepID=M2TR33_9SPHN|nr:Isochorismate pyruvate-lyase [Pacificimonas flava]